MLLTETHRKQIVYVYCILFYALAAFKYFNGLFLFQVKPALFNTRFDFSTWILMKTGIHQWLINNPTGWLIFDCIFYIFPLVFLFAFLKNKLAGSIAAACMLIINWLYIQCYTLYPTNSIESYMAWLLFPVAFLTTSFQSFYLILHALRYYFLYFFASAGVWKLTQGAVLHSDQMSGILLFQHAAFLVSSPEHWYTNFIYSIIQKPTLGFALYLAGILLELSFFIGFITRKYDKLLIVGFILFLLFDILLMRIHYWEVAAFLLTFFYSKYETHTGIKKPINYTR